MHRAMVRILEQTNEIRFRSFLQCQQCLRLEAETPTVQPCNKFAHEALEGHLPKKKLCRLLVVANLLQSLNTRAVPEGWLLMLITGSFDTSLRHLFLRGFSNLQGVFPNAPGSMLRPCHLGRRRKATNSK